jgi:hypothetical protein
LLRVGGPGVDLHLRSVQIVEEFVQRRDLISGLLTHLMQLEVIDHAVKNFVGQTLSLE